MTERAEPGERSAASYGSWLKSVDPDRPHLERLILLSDGVFAIALTLLALEVRPPEHWAGDWRGLATSMAIPMAAYFISFVILAATWAQHRRMFALLVKIDGLATVLNLIILSLAGLIPAAVNFELKYNTEIGALYIYAGVVISMNLAHLILWIYVALIKDFAKPAVNRTYRVWYAVLWFAAIAAGVFQALAIRLGADLHGKASLHFDRPTLLWALAAIAVSMMARWRRSRAHLYPAKAAAPPDALGHDVIGAHPDSA